MDFGSRGLHLPDPEYSEFMIAEMEKTYRDTWDWLNLPMGEANVIAFHSGLGDGLYATYAGTLTSRS